MRWSKGPGPPDPRTRGWGRRRSGAASAWATAASAAPGAAPRMDPAIRASPGGARCSVLRFGWHQGHPPCFCERINQPVYEIRGEVPPKWSDSPLNPGTPQELELLHGGPPVLGSM